MAKVIKRDWTISNAERFANQIAEIIVDPDNGKSVCKVFSNNLYMCDICPLEGICNDKNKLIRFLKTWTLR